MNGGAYDRRPLKSERLPGNATAEGAEKVDPTVSAVRKVAEQQAAGTYSEGFASFLPKPQLQGPPWAMTFMEKVVWHFPVSLLLPRLNFKVGGGGGRAIV